MNTTNGNASTETQSDPGAERADLCKAYIDEAMDLLHCAKRMLDLDELNRLDTSALRGLLGTIDVKLIEAHDLFDGDEARIVRPEDAEPQTDRAQLRRDALAAVETGEA